MKTKINSVLLCVTLWLGLLSCSQDEKEQNPTGPIAATFTPVMSELATRAVDNKWSGTETVGVAAFLEDDGTAHTTVFRQYAPNTSGTRTQLLPTAADQTIYYPISGDAITFTAFAPYQVPVDDKVSYTLTAQSSVTDNVSETVDFIYHVGTEGYSQLTPLATLNFEHGLSRVLINLTRGTAYSGSLAAATAVIGNVYGSVLCSLTDGAVSTVGSATSTITPFRDDENATATAVSFLAIVAPAANTARTLTITIDGDDFELSIPETYEPGCSYTYDLVFDQSQVHFLGCTITPWLTDPGNNTSGTVTGVMPEGWEDLIDWDAPIVFDGESNCYIVPTNGQLVIPISRAYKFAKEDGLSFDFPFLADGETFYTKIYWQDAGNVLASDDTFTNIGTGPNAYLLVKTGDDQGNAVVAVQKKTGNGDTDADFTTLWSWHVWVTNYVPSGKWMDRNLGALSNTYPASATDVASLGLYYQWGRKDPFPGTTTLEPTMNGEDLLYHGADPDWWKPVDNLEPTDYSVKFSVQNPVKFINNANWVGSNAAASWGPVSKTIYDPCPIGYKVPINTTWGSTSTYNPTTNAAAGWNGTASNYQYGVSYGGFYPTAGYRGSATGALNRVGTHGGYWSATIIDSATSYYLNFYGTTIHPGNTGNKWTGFSVRCIKQ